MAAPGASVAGAVGDIGKLKELRQRLLFVVFAILVFRTGSFIPIPGIDSAVLAQLFDQQRGTILDMFNMFSGGALSRLSIFALGIMPYISTSIVMQLAGYTVPHLQELKKEGPSGQRKITQYTRYGTVFLATLQGFGVAVGLSGQEFGGSPLVISSGPSFVITAVVTLATGTLFLMWLGEQVTERGLGNGISIIIFAGIVAGLPAAVGGTLELGRTGEMGVISILMLFVVAIAVTGFVVFVERGQRRITVNYAKRQQGRKVYGGQSTHLPLKLNMAGVIPPIFASAIILFPATLGSWFGSTEGMEWLRDITSMISPGQPLYVLLYAMAIVFFCFFYTALVFNARETADNLRKSGAFIPGIRPGEQTARYIDTVITRLTMAGAAYVTGVCLLPEFLILYWNVPFYFGGTSLLIIVIVTMDFISQVQAHMMSHQYDGLMKKANLRTGGRAGQLR